MWLIFLGVPRLPFAETSTKLMGFPSTAAQGNELSCRPTLQ